MRNDEAILCPLHYNLRSGLRYSSKDSPIHRGLEEKAYQLPNHGIEVRRLGRSVYHQDLGSILRSLVRSLARVHVKLPMAPIELEIGFLVLDVHTGTDIRTMTLGCHPPQLVIEAGAVRYPDNRLFAS